jgi:hypothetical protein
MAQATAGRARRTTSKAAAAPSPFSWGDRFFQVLNSAEKQIKKAWQAFQLYTTIATWSLIAGYMLFRS